MATACTGGSPVRPQEVCTGDCLWASECSRGWSRQQGADEPLLFDIGAPAEAPSSSRLPSTPSALTRGGGWSRAPRAGGLAALGARRARVFFLPWALRPRRRRRWRRPADALCASARPEYARPTVMAPKLVEVAGKAETYNCVRPSRWRRRSSAAIRLPPGRRGLQRGAPTGHHRHLAPLPACVLHSATSQPAIFPSTRRTLKTLAWGIVVTRVLPLLRFPGRTVAGLRLRLANALRTRPLVAEAGDAPHARAMECHGRRGTGR